MRDAYDILQIPVTADLAAIKNAYRKAARSYHPDRNHSQDASKIFAEIKHAYELLSDPERKREYDLRRSGRLLTDPHGEAVSIWNSYLERLK